MAADPAHGAACVDFKKSQIGPPPTEAEISLGIAELLMTKTSYRYAFLVYSASILSLYLLAGLIY